MKIYQGKGSTSATLHTSLHTAFKSKFLMRNLSTVLNIGIPNQPPLHSNLVLKQSATFPITGISIPLTLHCASDIFSAWEISFINSRPVLGFYLLNTVCILHKAEKINHPSDMFSFVHFTSEKMTSQRWYPPKTRKGKSLRTEHIVNHRTMTHHWDVTRPISCFFLSGSL